MKIAPLVLACVLLSGVASAQTSTTLAADKLVLNAGPCTLRSGVSGSGDPNSVITGNVCDTWMNSATGELWLKTSGSSGTSGWVQTVFYPWTKDFYPATTYSGRLGLLTKKWLSLQVAELWVETLVQSATMATIGGRILVGPTTALTSDLAAAGTYFYTKHNNLAVNDIVYMESGGKVEFFRIANGPYDCSVPATCDAGHTTDYLYGFSGSRDLDGTGANDWYAGDAIFNTGHAGSGFLDLYSVSGVKASSEYGPTIVGNVRNTLAYNDWSPRWAIGNLNGLYGYKTDTYGVAFGDSTKSWVKVDDVNGVTLGNGGTTHVSITPAGTATFVGDGDGITNIDGGNLQTGTVTATQITANTITAAQIAAQTITATEIAASTITGAKIAADTIESANIKAGTIEASDIKGSTITSDKLSVSTLSAISADLGSVTAGSIVVGSTNKLWLNEGGDGKLAMGGTDKDAAPFRVTAAGALTATNATLTGALTVADINEASPGGDYGHMVQLGDHGGFVGGNSTRTVVYGPDPGGGANYYVNVKGTEVDLGKGGTGDLLRVENASIGTFRTLLPDADVTRSIGNSDLYYEYGYFNHIDAARDTDSSVTSYTFQDLTPWPEDVDALAALLKIKGDGAGGIDHNSLPAYARKSLTRERVYRPSGPTLDGKPMKAERTGETETVPTRDLGAMVSLLTKAVQQQQAQIEQLKARIAELEAKK